MKPELSKGIIPDTPREVLCWRAQTGADYLDEVWDGFYHNEPRTAKYVGKRKLVANCIYRLGLSFGNFLRQTDDEMYEEDY